MNYVFGSGDFGGSTITQQLVKNLTGNDEITVKRKIREIFSAIDLEKKYDKTEILEMYMNIINLSHGCRGIGAAAEYYFSKEPTELTLAECATIAAITNNPSVYDPIKHPENTLQRRDTVLKCMLDQGYISDYEYREGINSSLELNVNSEKHNRGINSWYIDMVIDDVINDLSIKYNVDKKTASLMLCNGGFKIYTAVDMKIQGILEDYYTNIYNFPIDDDGNLPQSSMIVIDPYNGDILGVAGAVGIKDGNRLQNYATKTKRPPGSTIKPLSVYTLAIEEGIINWSTIFDDSPVKVENGRPWPQNVTRNYVGEVDIQYAIEHSLNTVAVKILDIIGNEKALTFLKDKLFIESLDENKDNGSASLALGQPTNGVTLRELTAAYSIFQEGIMSKPRSYYKVTDMSGVVILDNAPTQKDTVSRETAAVMTKLLETVVDTGTAAGKVSLDKKIDVAGKSGTTQNNYDRYFIGYTPELLAGVWMGYDYPKDLSVFGGNVSVYIWDEVMERIVNESGFGKGKSEFSVPNTVQRLSYGDDSKIGWFDVRKSHTGE
jgi:penicillin-binding protein 1A